MPGARSLRRSPPKGKAIRLVLAIIAAVLGYAAVVQSLAEAIRQRSPDKAHALAPGNGVISAGLAQALSGPNASTQQRDRADRLARSALKQDPTTADAAVTLGTNAEIHGDKGSARRLFTYAQMLTRRNLQAQLWAIEDSVERNDIPAVLTHYNIALQTSPTASALLLPVLSAAIADPAVRMAVARNLALPQQRAWVYGFLAYTAQHGPDAEATASLFRTLPKLGFKVPDHDAADLVKTFIASGRFDEAWAYYASVRPHADRRRSRDPEFRENLGTPSPFDWVPVNDGSISASIQPNGNRGNALIFTAPPSVGGQVVKQTQMLPAGDYRLSGRTEGIAQARDARPYWSLTCSGGQEIGRVDVSDSASVNGQFMGHFAVPEDCPVQVLAFNLRPSSDIAGSSGQIDRVMIQPAR